jgi:hypothetical protein
MISPTGHGLNILISCDYTPEHNWMSYLCWYSIKKTLSDAKVFVCSRRINVSGSFFIWTKKFSVPFKMYNGEYKFENVFDQKSLLIVSPHIVAIRDFEEAGMSPELKEDPCLLDNTNLLKDASTNDFCVFCSYLNGWGNFVTSEWINNTTCPLLIFKKFSKSNMTINEKRIEKIWNNSIPLFQGILGG